MHAHELVAVTSRSFSKHPILRTKLQKIFPAVKFNEGGLQFVGQSLVDFLKGATHAIIGLERIEGEMLYHLPDLKVICKMGTGIDKIDLNSLKERRISFFHTPGANKRSVSELVLGLIFTLYRHLSQVNERVHHGVWSQPKGQLLSNKTVGIVGFGAVGQDLLLLLRAFNCRCLIFDIIEHPVMMQGASQVSLENLLTQSDIISLHIPLTPQSRYFLDTDEFAKMKKNAVLINTARGGLVNEKALYNVLKNRWLAAAALDVFEEEPRVSKELLSLDNFFATSHIAGSTEEAIEAMGSMIIDYLKKQ